MQPPSRLATTEPPVIDGDPPRIAHPTAPPYVMPEPPIIEQRGPAQFAWPKPAESELAEPQIAVADLAVLEPAQPEGIATPSADNPETGAHESGVVATERRPLWKKLVWNWPLAGLGGAWNVMSLTVLLAIVAAIPLVQLISLGYLLKAAANLSAGRAWSTAFPGVRLAGRIATFAMLTALLWLPVWLVTDLSYSVQLLRPGTAQAAAWRIAAFVVASVWLVWVTWAAMRGGRWWHLMWPSPIGFVKQIWRPTTWSKAADDLWALFERTRSLELWWLGLRAAVGALVWLAIPVTMMIIGLRAERLEIAPLIGLIGALSLTWIMLLLPFQQILVAERNRFAEIFNIREVRRRFNHAPLAMGLSLIALYALAIPLYLLRIEATPEQLTWLPSLFFVAIMFPSKLALGAAMGYGARRPKPRHITLRWPVKLLCMAGSLTYVGALYIAQFVAWQGVYVMYFQHAVLVPVAN